MVAIYHCLARAMTNNKSELLDQVFEEWNSLVQREEEDAYKVMSLECDGNKSPDRVLKSCPTTFRGEICDWCYQVIDQCHIERGIVGIALDYFDRYLSKISFQKSMNEVLVQLVAITSLYLAVKVHSTRKISVSSMISLSQGIFEVDQLLKMEECIIKTFRWRLNPPIPSIYLHVASPLICDSEDEDGLLNNVLELSTYLLELSVCDWYFRDKMASSVACAAVLAALNILDVPQSTFTRYGLKNSPVMTKLCTSRLHQVYLKTLVLLGSEDEPFFKGGSSPNTVF